MSGGLRRFGFGIVCAIPSYIAGAVAGGLLVQLFSSNVHDRSLEAAMTGAFFAGPIAALAGFIAGILFAGRSNTRFDPTTDTKH
jgi:Na+/proline symporter